MKRSTPGSSRHDSVRKRLSGTFWKSRDSFPNSKRPGSASRNSSIYRRGIEQGPLKDPRNLSSKGTQREMIDEILNFLQENSFPHHITNKILQAPASKDFVKVFEFLYGFIDGSEKIGKKIEEEFPRLMKQLRYPFPIAKSAMFTIGSLHTWPSLLAALHWLVKLIDMMNCIDPEKLLGMQNDQDPVSGCEQLIHRFYEKTYKDFMNDIFDNEEDDIKLKDAILAQSGATEENDEILRNEVEILDQQLIGLEAEPNRLKDMQQNIEFWKAECHKMERRHEDMKDEKRIRESRIKKMNEEIHKFDYRRVQQIKCNGSIQHERERLVNRLGVIDAENKDLQNKCWEMEVNFSEASSKLNKKLAEYGDIERKISSNPKALEYLQGQSIEMKFDHQQTEFTNPTKFKVVIKDVLINAQNQALSDVRRLESDEITEEEKLEKLIDSTKETEYKLESLKAKLEKMTIELESVIKKNDQEQNELDEELASLKEEKKMHEIGNSGLLEKKKLNLARKKEQLEKEKAEIEEKQENMAKFLNKVVLKAKEHKDKIKAGRFRIEEMELKRKEDLENIEPLN